MTKRQYKSFQKLTPAPVKITFWKRLDKTLILAAILCSAISTILLYSIWKNEILSSVGSSYYQTQLISCILGVICLLILAAADYQKFIKLWYIYAPVALILVFLTFTSLGYKREGADDQAWLNLGFTTFQPSELLKLAFIGTFALHLSKDEKNMNHPLHMLLLVLHGLFPIGLVGLQGDYGTAIVFSVIFMGMILSAKINWKYVLAAAILIPVMAILAWNFILGDIHKKRILVLLHPGTDPENLEYQQDKGLSALSNGKLSGVGLFAGNDAYVSVPELHNDFMFAQVGQVFGFVGAIVVLILLTFICLKILSNGFHAKNHMGMFLCTGVFSLFYAHCVMNIGMVLKVMPVIGVPLPFISAGGSATVCMYIALGIVISVYSQNKKLILLQK